MTHLIGMKRRTACGLDTLAFPSDRISVKRQECTCSACQANLADYEAAYRALAPRAFRNETSKREE